MEDTMRNLARKRVQRNIVMDGDTMIDKKTGEALDPGLYILIVNSLIHYWDNFERNARVLRYFSVDVLLDS